MRYESRERRMERDPICYQIGRYHGNTVLDFLRPYERCHEHMQKKEQIFTYQYLPPCSKIVLRDIKFLTEEET